MRRWITAVALGLAAGGAVPTAAPAGADPIAAIQPVARLGERIGDLAIKPDGHFEIGTLTDEGRLLSTADTAAGGQALIQYSGGQRTPIVVPGGTAAGGQWPADVAIVGPVSMNQAGQAVFAAPITLGGATAPGTFRWDARQQQVVPVALKGMPAVNGLSFAEGGFLMAPPVINNHGDVVFVAQVPGADG